jgi:tellurite resistance protein
LDPISAVCNAIVAVCALWEKMIDGQTPEQRAQMWQQFLDAQKDWQKFWNLTNRGK